PEREELVDQLLQGLVQELPSSAGVQLLAALLRRLEAEDLPRQPLEGTVGKGGETGRGERALRRATEPCRNGGNKLRRGAELPTVGSRRREALPHPESCGLGRAQCTGIGEPWRAGDRLERGRRDEVRWGAAEVGRDGRLERQAEAGPGGTRCLLEGGHRLGGEVALLRPRDGEETLHQVRGGAARSPPPSQDDPARRGGGAAQAPTPARPRRPPPGPA